MTNRKANVLIGLAIAALLVMGTVGVAMTMAALQVYAVFSRTPGTQP